MRKVRNRLIISLLIDGPRDIKEFTVIQIKRKVGRIYSYKMQGGISMPKQMSRIAFFIILK